MKEIKSNIRWFTYHFIMVILFFTLFVLTPFSPLVLFNFVFMATQIYYMYRNLLEAFEKLNKPNPKKDLDK